MRNKRADDALASAREHKPLRPLRWWLECKQCDMELHPNDPGSPSSDEEDWIREHHDHGMDLVFEDPNAVN